jgi:hypothetical protein
MFKSANWLRGVLVVGAVIGWALSASGDTKAYHGAICRNAVQLGSGFDHQAWDNGFFNTDSSSVFAVCPLIRDRVSATNTLTSVVVEGFNRIDHFDPGASDFTCTLVSQNEDALGSTLDTHRLTAPLGQGFKQLGPFSVDSSSGNEGSYALRCALDKDEGIYHVYVSENNGVD